MSARLAAVALTALGVAVGACGSDDRGRAVRATDAACREAAGRGVIGGRAAGLVAGTQVAASVARADEGVFLTAFPEGTNASWRPWRQQVSRLVVVAAATREAGTLRRVGALASARAHLADVARGLDATASALGAQDCDAAGLGVPALAAAQVTISDALPTPEGGIALRRVACERARLVVGSGLRGTRRSLADALRRQRPFDRLRPEATVLGLQDALETLADTLGARDDSERIQAQAARRAAEAAGVAISTAAGAGTPRGRATVRRAAAGLEAAGLTC